MAELNNLSMRIVLAAEAASPTVRLVGGTGLALLLHHRRSDDLDLFGEVRENMEPVVRAIEAAAGHVVSRVRSVPGFSRLEVPLDGAVLRVDVASDASPRLVRTDTLVDLIRVESLRDQRANKIAAILGRSELRDLVDLYFIDRAGLPAEEGFADAAVKDAGLDPAWLAWSLDQIDVVPLSGMCAPLDIGALKTFRDRVRRAALDLAGTARP